MIEIILSYSLYFDRWVILQTWNSGKRMKWQSTAEALFDILALSPIQGSDASAVPWLPRVTVQTVSNPSPTGKFTTKSHASCLCLPSIEPILANSTTSYSHRLRLRPEETKSKHNVSSVRLIRLCSWDHTRSPTQRATHRFFHFSVVLSTTVRSSTSLCLEILHLNYLYCSE